MAIRPMLAGFLVFLTYKLNHSVMFSRNRRIYNKGYGKSNMKKQTIITILLALVAVTGQAQVKCHVVGTVADGTTPVELVIYRDGEDPKNSTLRPEVKDSRFE